MSWDEDVERWMRRWRRTPFLGFKAFDQVDRIFDNMFKEMLESAPKELYRERKLPGGGVVREMGPFVYGYSMTLGPDGKPIIREFGNVKPSSKLSRHGYRKPSLELREEREPLVDIISEDGTIQVLAELPGVEKNDIKLNCTEKTLAITVDTEQRRYFKEVELPTEIDPKVSKASYNNGVLKVTLTKAKKEPPKGESIKID